MAMDGDVVKATGPGTYKGHLRLGEVRLAEMARLGARWHLARFLAHQEPPPPAGSLTDTARRKLFLVLAHPTHTADSGSTV